MEQGFTQIILLLGLAVTIVVVFQRLHIPSSLGYLFVGVMLGPYTLGPVLDVEQIRAVAEFGIVFLLFTIGLNFSLSQIRSLRYQVLGLGLGQVIFTTAAIGLAAWLLGLPGAAAFVVGAVFTQSSTSIISKQLLEQGEEHSRHGRLGMALSVFQDVTAVPFVVIIPVLGLGVGLFALAEPLSVALGKALLAFLVVFVAGSRLLHPLFRVVAKSRSAEVFTLTVLFVSLLAAWVSHHLGVPMAFGAFLAGMVLGETEFRPQVEATIRPFRDVLLGLFFIGIGMLFDPGALLYIWQWALAATLSLLLIKAIVVVAITYRAGIDILTSWRIGLLLAVGGEFGFALLAIALGAEVIEAGVGQIALTSVLLSMIIAPFIIRYNHAIAGWLSARTHRSLESETPQVELVDPTRLHQHVIICGYGRIGQNVGRFLEEEKISYVALDLEPTRVREAHTAGEFVYYGDAAERAVLETVGLEQARFVLISHDDVASALKTLQHIRSVRPELPVMVRTRDQAHVRELLAAGASEVVPETVEAGLMIASQTLILLGVPTAHVLNRMSRQRSLHYRLLREFFRGDSLTEDPREHDADRLRSVVLHPYSSYIGQPLGAINLDGVVITALVRAGKRQLSPPADSVLAPGDVLVLFGSAQDLYQAEQVLLR